MLPQVEIIRTKNLSLKILTAQVYDELFQFCDDDELMQFLGLNQLEELEAEKEKYELGLSTYRVSFVYFHILKDDRFLGDCGFHTWYPKHARAEIGYTIRKEEDRAQGYMSEVFPAILNYGFNTMNLHRVEAMVGRNNQASQRLLLKYGFSQEGLLREHYYVNENYEDSLVFSLLKTEWKSSD